MNSGEMPPKDKKQLSTVEKTEFLADLSNKMVAAWNIHSDSGKNIIMRRLNRREYANTIRDLVGVEVSVDDVRRR